MAGDGRGGVFLERNPFKGYKLPKEKNPLRVVLTDDEHEGHLKPPIDVCGHRKQRLVLVIREHDTKPFFSRRSIVG